MVFTEKKHSIERWQQGSAEFEAISKKDEVRRQEIYIKKLQRLVEYKEILLESQRKHAGW